LAGERFSVASGRLDARDRDQPRVRRGKRVTFADAAEDE
jgi:hypothetical protein